MSDDDEYEGIDPDVAKRMKKARAKNDAKRRKTVAKATENEIKGADKEAKRKKK